MTSLSSTDICCKHSHPGGHETQVGLPTLKCSLRCWFSMSCHLKPTEQQPRKVPWSSYSCRDGAACDGTSHVLLEAAGKTALRDTTGPSRPSGAVQRSRPGTAAEANA